MGLPEGYLDRTGNFLLGVEQGRYQGYNIIHKFGRNSDQDSADLPADLWDGGGGGGEYTGFPVSDSEKVELVSSSASDTNDVFISGLDDDYNEVSETITLTGTTPVDSLNTYRRVNRGYNASGTNFVGTITCRHTTTTTNVFFVIPPTSPVPNQTQIAAYTVPAGYDAYLLHVRSSMFTANTVRCSGGFYIREPGGVFRMNVPFDVAGGQQFSEDFPGGIPYGPKTDMIIRIHSASGNNVPIIGRFDLLLVQR